MAEMARVTLRRPHGDLDTLDALRGELDRSTFIRHLLREGFAQRGAEPDLEPDDDEGFKPFDADHLERLHALTT
jgi:hypothetical protein